ncbi:MAG: subclass B1 metallo-beta-lactamase [Prolixibacteraceae bacterium]|nr:subclass B1 metallo-beta-lactamase [Prolixibacteraceae bacterium]
MKRLTLFLATVISTFLTGFSQQTNIISINQDIELIPITPGFYIHVSYTNSEQYGRYPSNGMIVVENGKALMIDTPDNDLKTGALYNFLADSMGIETTLFIGGHFHDDCIGGLGFLKTKGVKSILNERTRKKCIEFSLPLPDTTFDKTMDFSFEDTPVQIRYFGGGHTIDNIVVYFPGEKILFGGCLIKSLDSRGLGNLADAVVSEWKSTIEKVIEAFPDVEVVVPGHGSSGDAALLHHTVELVQQYNNR